MGWGSSWVGGTGVRTSPPGNRRKGEFFAPGVRAGVEQSVNLHPAVTKGDHGGNKALDLHNHVGVLGDCQVVAAVRSSHRGEP